jgi:hemerythrin
MKHMIEWKPQYSVGVVSIDAQHQTLFAISQELYTAMSAGKGRTVLARILGRLAQYTAMHFAHEERLMKQHNFPGFEAHCAEHRKLTRQVLDFQQEFEAGRTALSVQLLQFLMNWLVHHIQESDLKYAPHMKSRAVA